VVAQGMADAVLSDPRVQEAITGQRRATPTAAQ
jgi:hypothetical protein